MSEPLTTLYPINCEPGIQPESPLIYYGATSLTNQERGNEPLLMLIPFVVSEYHMPTLKAWSRPW